MVGVTRDVLHAAWAPKQRAPVRRNGRTPVPRMLPCNLPNHAADCPLPQPRRVCPLPQPRQGSVMPAACAAASGLSRACFARLVLPLRASACWPAGLGNVHVSATCFTRLVPDLASLAARARVGLRVRGARRAQRAREVRERCPVASQLHSSFSARYPWLSCPRNVVMLQAY